MKVDSFIPIILPNLNPICHLLALGAHHILHVGSIRVNISSFTTPSFRCCSFFRIFTKLFTLFLFPLTFYMFCPSKHSFGHPNYIWWSGQNCGDPLISIVFVLPSHPRSQVQIFSSALLVAIINPLNTELNPICYLLALLAHHFLHISRIRVKSLTHRLLMSYIYIYGAPILDVSRSHTTTQHSR